jgi:hypothetical protein
MSLAEVAFLAQCDTFLRRRDPQQGTKLIRGLWSNRLNGLAKGLEILNYYIQIHQAALWIQVQMVEDDPLSPPSASQ